MPSRPVPLDPVERAKFEPQNPYEKIAAELRRRILAGELVEGDLAPTEKQLAAEYHVAFGTAHRAMELLKTWGLITSSRGRRATVIRPPDQPVSHLDAAPAEPLAADVPPPSPMAVEGRRLLDLEIRRMGQVVKKITTEADPKDPRELRQLLVEAVKRAGGQESQIAEYEMDIRSSGSPRMLGTFVTTVR
jgi:DNA-binding FadR family transcriptional regulator